MKQYLIRLLLRWLGVPTSILPKVHFYAVCIQGERIAEVTVNKNRAVAMTRELDAKGTSVALYRFVAERKEPY